METLQSMSFYDAINKFFIGSLLMASAYNWPELHPNGELPVVPDEIFWLLFVISSFLVGTIAQMIIEAITHKWRNSPSYLLKAHQAVYEKYASVTQGLSKEEIEKNIELLYYKAYYNVTRNNLLLNIPNLEAVERFTRSLIFVLPVCIFAACCHHGLLFTSILLPIPLCCKVMLILLFAAISYYVRSIIQMKIHKLVWEAHYNITILESEKTTNNQTK